MSKFHWSLRVIFYDSSWVVHIPFVRVVKFKFIIIIIIIIIIIMLEIIIISLL